MKNRAIWLALLFFVFGCTAVVRAGDGIKPHTLLLDYDEFGPQVIAHELIGMRMYQWNTQGFEDRREKVVVVVYAGQSLDTVRKQFPVDRAMNHDYRYVSQKAALGFLTKKIDELKGDRDGAELQKSLSATRKKLQEFAK